MANQFKDIPLPSDLLSVSQSDLKGNFDYIQGALGKDHQIVFGDTDTGTTFEGRHLQVSLKSRANPNPNTTDGSNAVLFCNSNNELAYTNATLGAGTAVQLTSATISAQGSAIGYSFLPGGVMIQWGKATTTGLLTAFTFAGLGAKSFPSLAFSLTVTPLTNVINTNGQIFAITAFSTTGFSIGRSSAYSGNIDFFYIALGQ